MCHILLLNLSCTTLKSPGALFQKKKKSSITKSTLNMTMLKGITFPHTVYITFPQTTPRSLTKKHQTRQHLLPAYGKKFQYLTCKSHILQHIFKLIKAYGGRIAYNVKTICPLNQRSAEQRESFYSFLHEYTK